MPDPAAALRAGCGLAQHLMHALRDPTFLPAIYPSVFLTGVDDGSLHAYMLSALVLVGDRLGYTPVCDAPIFDRLDRVLTGDGAKRPDAVWFRRGASDVQCLIEFERYSGRSLVPKAQNLLVMGKELMPSPELVVLNYWTYTSCFDKDLHAAEDVFAHGFQHTGGMTFRPLDCPALILETLVNSNAGRAVVVETRPRLFIAARENKRYIVEQLMHRLGATASFSGATERGCSREEA